MFVLNRVINEIAHPRPKGRSLLLIDTNDLFRGILLEEAVIVVVHFLTQRAQRKAFILTFGRDIRRDDGSNVVDREIGDLKFFRQGGAQGRFPASRWTANQIEHILRSWRSNVIAKSVRVASAGCDPKTLSKPLANSVQNH